VSVPRWRGRSLRARLAAAITLVVAAAIAAGFAGAYLLAAHELRRDLDESLVRAATGVGLDVKRAGWSTPVGECVYLASPACAQVVTDTDDGDGVLPVPASVRALTAGGPARFGSTTLDGLPLRTYAVPLGSGRVALVALRSDGVAHTLARLRTVFAVLGALGIAVGVLLSLALATGLARPVRRLTAVTEQIAAGGEDARRLRVSRARPGGRGHADEVTRLGESFDRMLDALAASEEARRRLVTDASHELRTPLTSIRAHAQLLGSGRLTEAQRQRAAADLVAGVDEMTGLVGDVVEVARGEEAVHPVEPLDLGALLAAQVEAARRHWPAIAVTAELGAGPLLVDGVPARLARLIANLLDNAAKFSPAGGAVTASLERDGDAVVLRVRDHGPGFAEADLPHVFDRFYRSAAARGLPGSGLGLAMVRQIAEAHRAEVSAANAEDGGAIITVALPAS
jgi:two-component system, OmpR family, sensor histidine kinase MprB